MRIISAARRRTVALVAALAAALTVLAPAPQAHATSTCHYYLSTSCPTLYAGAPSGQSGATAFAQAVLVKTGMYGVGTTFSAHVDGIYGAGTTAAVKNFQSAHSGSPWNLSVDGAIGKNTWRALLSHAESNYYHNDYASEGPGWNDDPNACRDNHASSAHRGCTVYHDQSSTGDSHGYGTAEPLELFYQSGSLATEGEVSGHQEHWYVNVGALGTCLIAPRDNNWSNGVACTF